MLREECGCIPTWKRSLVLSPWPRKAFWPLLLLDNQETGESSVSKDTLTTLCSMATPFSEKRQAQGIKAAVFPSFSRVRESASFALGPGPGPCSCSPGPSVLKLISAKCDQGPGMASHGVQGLLQLCLGGSFQIQSYSPSKLCLLYRRLQPVLQRQGWGTDLETAPSSTAPDNGCGFVCVCFLSLSSSFFFFSDACKGED